MGLRVHMVLLYGSPPLCGNRELHHSAVRLTDPPSDQMRPNLTRHPFQNRRQQSVPPYDLQTLGSGAYF